MLGKRVSNNIINKEDIDFLINLTQDEVEKLSFIMDNFGEFLKNLKQKYGEKNHN